MGEASAPVRNESPVATSRSRSPRTTPAACVLGNCDLIRALGLAGIRSAVVAPRGSPAAWSRFAVARIPRADNWRDPDGMLANLSAFGERHLGTPLIFQHDADLSALVSKFGSTP